MSLDTPSNKEPRSKFARELAADPEKRKRYEEAVEYFREQNRELIEAIERSTQFTADDWKQPVS